jgi:hypothetical protein
MVRVNLVNAVCLEYNGSTRLFHFVICSRFCPSWMLYGSYTGLVKPLP